MPEEINELSGNEAERIIQDAETKYRNKAKSDNQNEETDNQEYPEANQPIEQKPPEQPERKVSALDPDFIIFFFAACFFDCSDVFTDLITTIIQIPLPKMFGIVIDVLALVIIGGWIYLRTGRLLSTEKALKDSGKIITTVAKKIVPAAVIEIGSGIGLGITSWIGLIPSWAAAVLSMLI